MNVMKPMTLEQHANVYHNKKMVILPIRVNGKMPNIAGWQNRTIKDNENVLKNIRAGHQTNLGILTGKVSGVIVIDVDVKRVDGMATLAGLEEELGALPTTVKALTPSGGIHLYFNYPKGVVITNKCPVGPGIDIQSDGSQCVAAPSTTADGIYDWENDPISTQFADLPKAWVERLAKERTAVASTGSKADGTVFIAPTDVLEGGRNVTLTQVAGKIIGKRKLSKERAYEELCKANQKICVPPLDEKEVMTIFKSIWSKQERTMTAEYMATLDRLTESEHDDFEEQQAMEEFEECNDDSADEFSWGEPGEPVHIPTPKEEKKTKKSKKSRKEAIAEWYKVDEKGKSQFLDEQFIKWFVAEKDLIKFEGVIYAQDTQDQLRVDADLLGEWVVNIIGSLFINGTLQPLVAKLVKLIPLYVPRVSIDGGVHEVHFKNGSYTVENGIMEQIHRKFSTTFIPHEYNAQAKCPTWERYVSELLSPDDARTLQQYMGYCMTPNTRAQVGLFICGKGGEGKSRITPIMNAIFNDSIYMSKLKTVAENQFGLAALQHKLVVFDDDLDMDAFRKTDRLKELITTETMMEVNQKGIAIRNLKLHARIFAIGNGFPRTLYDTTDGWHRRIHPVVTKPIPADRVIDPNFGDKLMAELDGIIAWAIRGLIDFMNNGQQIYTSESTVEIKKSLTENDGDSLTKFLECGAIEFTNNESDYVIQRDFAEYYEAYCKANRFEINKSIPSRVTKYRQFAGHEPKLAAGGSKRVGVSKITTRVYTGMRYLG